MVPGKLAATGYGNTRIIAWFRDQWVEGSNPSHGKLFSRQREQLCGMIIVFAQCSATSIIEPYLGDPNWDACRAS